jgi:Dihydroprymidine dehydrogenase domain II, 4Fe-4S cluster
METANGPRKRKKTIRMIPQARTPAHEQDPSVRARNFEEVNCGYLVEDAQLEAERCLMCPDQPCVRGCPVALRLWPRLPAGKPVRGCLHGRRVA